MKNSVWPRPTVIPIPDETYGTGDIYRNLLVENWRMNLDPDADFFEKDADLSGWTEKELPDQVTAHGHEYAFARDIEIPADWSDSRILIRFDGVNCYARVFLDGQYIMDHYGGFVSWDCELTDHVTPGKTHRLTLGVTDKADEVNGFHQGGILRDITLVRLPKTYMTRLHADTLLNDTYENAELKVYLGLKGADADIRLSLTAPEGGNIALGEVRMGGGTEQECSFRVEKPLLWDAEHPYLYMLTAEVLQEGCVIEKTHRRIGFRMLEKRGNQVFLNGKELKLHGVNHHDIHPKTGRAISRELAETDVKLFREANVNFVRTSHYPPRPDFLDFCDEYGIYVEDEIAVAFLGQGTDCRENDPAYTDRFLGQFSEMIERDRSHPSVIIYSLANESIWGTNFELENRYAHEEDPGRLTIFSYPITAREDDDRADIWSMHYAAWDQSPIALVDSFNRSEHEEIPWPVLHDESTHIPCYCRNDLKRDPGVRDFWGVTIREFYNKLFSTKGALGCAIWAGIDDVRANASYHAPWGIIDGWRRKKPEFYHVRKAYAPVRTEGVPYEKDSCIALRAENRFNHTDFAEMTIHWTLNAPDGTVLTGTVSGLEVPAHAQGEILIPAAFIKSAKLKLDFLDAFHYSVDEEAYILGAEREALPGASGETPVLSEQEETVTVSGADFEYTFSKATGLIACGRKNGQVILTGGPYLKLTGLALAPWEKEQFSWQITGQEAVLTADGAYGKVRVRFEMHIDGSGLLTLSYTVLDMPYPSPRKLAMRIGDDTDSGGYEEAGVYFTVPHTLDTLSWERNGEWSVYPDWHIARNKGTAKKHSDTETFGLGTEPVHGYEEDEIDPIVFGPYDPGLLGTLDFRSLKSYIFRASLENETGGLTALSDGTDSVRIELQHKPELIVNDRDPQLIYEGNWVQVDTKNRSFEGTETWSNHAGDSCTVKFTGTGIVWTGSFDIIGGFAKVYVDGELKDSRINLGNRQLTPGIARGYEKIYRQLLFAVQDLPYGEHELRIEVAGEHMPGAMGDYVFIDRFLILTADDEGDSHFIIDSEFNYPELSWGCYTKPQVKVGTGYTKTARIRMDGKVL